MSSFGDRLPTNAQAHDPASLQRHYGGGDGLLPLWIAEPYVDLAPEVIAALEARTATGWYGYETRPAAVLEAFWGWMVRRHGWDGSDLKTAISPSVGTSIGALIDLVTDPGDGVILQPPVFTDFKPLVVTAGRTVLRNPLQLTEDGYRMDLDGLEALATAPTTRAMILCNPHNPVGRAWRPDELATVARICADSGVFIVADEIHADLVLTPHRFTPFAPVAAEAGARSASLHGPIKTFGLAGVCDTLLATADDAVADGFEAMSSRLHLTRNNVFGLAAFEAAYSSDGSWLDGLLAVTAANVAALQEGLPGGIRLIHPEGTYLAWLDLRSLGMDVPTLARWLAADARLALSPGHWFGREGAGFARMTIAAPTAVITEATKRLAAAVPPPS